MSTALAIPLSLLHANLSGPFLVQVGYYDRDAKVHITELSVPDIQAAIRMCDTYREEEDLRGDDWAGGALFRDDGTRVCVAVISQNGRVWAPSGSKNPEGLPLPSTQEFI